MNTIARHMTATLALCAGATCLAQAPTAPKTQADTAKIDFVTVDKDRSGGLSRQEADVIADLKSAFEQLDANQDQSVSPTEFALWSRAARTPAKPPDPATAPRGSAGAQHMPEAD
jgi:hypothetical protein